MLFASLILCDLCRKQPFCGRLAVGKSQTWDESRRIEQACRRHQYFDMVTPGPNLPFQAFHQAPVP